MSEFGDGLSVAHALRDCMERLARCELALAEHDASAGAHAAAFEAHNLSPGAVEDAEALATDIIDEAIETATIAVDAVEEASAAAVEAVTDAADTAAEPVVEAAAPDSGEEPASEGEREPARTHFLHKQWFGKKG